MSESHNSRHVFLSYGFRPFFLLAALWSAGAMGVWLWILHAGALLPTRFDPMSWHIHEMLFGFVMAAIAGFLLTAVANWTNRPPVAGAELALLVIAWVAGRLACWFSALLPEWLAMFLDLVLPILLAAIVAREVIAARNWRNLPMVLPAIVLGFANLLMHLESFGIAISVGLGWRLAIAAVVVLVSAVGGRIVPAFTRNWLKKSGGGDVPGHGLVDRLSLGLLHIGLMLWAFLPQSALTAYLLVAAAAVNTWRLLRWRGYDVREELLLLVLHVGYCWLIVGVALVGLSILWQDVPFTAAIHALTAGTVGTMVLAVMTRATRGHTGRPLTADRATIAIYALVFTAGVSRVAAGFDVWNPAMLNISALLWMGAYGAFVLIYGPMLARPRASVTAGS